MRILIVTAMFPPNRTGTSFYSMNLATALANRGNEISVVTTINSDFFDDKDLKFPVYRIPAWHIPIKNFFKHLRFCSLIPSNYRLMHKVVKDFEPDAIVLVNHYLDIAFPIIYAARKTNIPLYISVGTQLQSLNRFKNVVLRFLDRLIVGNLIFPAAKRIISWDKEIERYISDVHSSRNSSKSFIIPFGVNGDISNFNKFKNIYEPKNQILGVGAIIGHRDYLYQINVFAELLKKYPDLRLKIVGNQYIDKPIRLAKKLGISDKIDFTGELPHEKVLEEYKNSAFHWMMLNGEYVGLGTSTLEAMLMGVPSISNVPENLFGFGGLRDMHNYIHTDGKTIMRDVEKLSELLANRSLQEQIGCNGKVFINKYLDWSMVSEMLVTMIEKDVKNS